VLTSHLPWSESESESESGWCSGCWGPADERNPQVHDQNAGKPAWALWVGGSPPPPITYPLNDDPLENPNPNPLSSHLTAASVVEVSESVAVRVHRHL